MMKALIIEDETAAARNLAAILRQTAPDVEIVAIDKNKPAAGDSARVPLVMAVKAEGSAAAVEAAVAAGKAEAEKRDLYITHKVIARQSEDIEWFARLNALGKDKLR